jgi:hypothetical protein
MFLKPCLVALAIIIPGAASAAVERVSEADFMAGSGLITFSEFAGGTVNPTYAPATYGGGAGAPTVTFAGYFSGQSLSATPGADCPGAAASACVVGNPTGPLSLSAGSPNTFITGDGSNPTSPVLSGSPTFNGPIAILFDTDQFGVGFDGGYFNAVGSTGITAFARDGTLLGTVSNTGIGIEFLGLVSTDPSQGIAGVFLDLVGSEPAGFAIDNVRFGIRGQVNPGGGGVPEPGIWAMMILGMGGVGAVLRRRRAAGLPAFA